MSKKVFRGEENGDVAARRGRRRTRDTFASVRALERGLTLLEVLSETRELTLSDIARRVGLPYSTTHRLLETLIARNFVAQTASGSYRIGIRAFEVGTALTQDRLHEAAHAHMRAVAQALNESVNLAVLDGRHAVIVHQVDARRFAGLFTPLGTRARLHSSAVGKALLAGRSETEIRALLGRDPLPAFTANTLTKAARVVKAVARVRTRGYALDDEEGEIGIRCVAVPIAVDGKTVAAMSVAAPAARVPRARVTAIAATLAEGARAIAAQLTGRRAADIRRGPPSRQ